MINIIITYKIKEEKYPYLFFGSPTNRWGRSTLSFLDRVLVLTSKRFVSFRV